MWYKYEIKLEYFRTSAQSCNPSDSLLNIATESKDGFTINVKNDNDIIYESKSIIGRNSVYACLSNGNYKVEIMSPTQANVIVNVYLNNGFSRKETVAIDTAYSFIVKINNLAAPLLHYKPQELFVGVYYDIFPDFTENDGCISFISTDEIPGMKIGEFGNYYGIPTKRSSKIQSMRCRGAKDTGIANNIRLFSYDCPIYSTPYILKVDETNNAENLLIIFKTDTEYVFSTIEGVTSTTFYKSECVQFKSFTVTISNFNQSKPSATSKITLTYNGEEKSIVFSGDDSIFKSSEYTAVSDDVSWEVSDTYFEDFKIDFEYNSWNKIKLSNLPLIKTTTRYYRNLWKPSISIEKIDVLEFTVTFNGGMALYINGINVFIKDLMVNPNADSIPTSNSDKIDYRFTIPGNVLRSGLNYISIEVHHSLLEVNDIFRINFKIIPTEDGCSKRTYFSYMDKKMIVTEKTIKGNSDPNSFDLLFDTEFSGAIPASNSFATNILYKYPDNYRETFNTYVIVSGIDCPNADPLSWQFLSDFSANGTFEVKDTISDGKILGDISSNPGNYRKTIYKFPLKDSYQSYEGYIFNVKSVKSTTHQDTSCQNKLKYSEIYVENCKHKYCTKNNIPSSYINLNSYFECPIGKIGRIKQLCSENNSTAILEDENSNCASKISSIDYPNSNQLTLKVNFVETYLPQFGGGSSKGPIYINDTLPNGVLFDPKTGSIYGTPLEEVDEKKYDICSFFIFPNEDVCVQISLRSLGKLIR